MKLVNSNNPSDELRVVLAFDSFKGSLGATEACEAAAKALEDRFGSRVRTVLVPMADGGEGSLTLISRKFGLETITADTVDAIGRPIQGHYLVDEKRRTAYIEVAQAAGLPQVSDVPLRPLQASSYGVGLLIVDALRHGAVELNLFLGGSATTDGGAGIITALGGRLLGADGSELSLGGGALEYLDRVETDGILPSAYSARWSFITDVSAPLTGFKGAARQYSPQKGAQSTEVDSLERGLDRLTSVLEDHHEFGNRNLAGIGSAGGMAALPAALFQTAFQRGGMFFAAQLGLPDALQAADLIITGEGSFDEQSLEGKVVGTVAELASQNNRQIPVVVIAGDVSGAPVIHTNGLSAVFSISEGAASLVEMQRHAPSLLSRKVVEVVSLVREARASSSRNER